MTGALAGGLLGLVAGILSVASLWLIVGIAAKLARGLKPTPEAERPSGWDPEREAEGGAPGVGREFSTFRATLRLLFAFLLKAPLLVLVALGAQRLGVDALHWCVGGVVLVYSLAVFWAAARTVRR